MFSDSVLGVAREVVIVNTDRHPLGELDEEALGGLHLGWLPGYSLTPRIKQLFPGAVDASLPDGIDEVGAVRMLIDGEIDAFLSEELVIRDILYETFPDDLERIRAVPGVLEERELRLVAPRHQRSFIEEFDTTFAVEGAAIQLIQRRYSRSKGVVLRAFPGEPEEVAWVLLSMLGGAPMEGDLAEAEKRIETANLDGETMAVTCLLVLCYKNK